MMQLAQQQPAQQQPAQQQQQVQIPQANGFVAAPGSLVIQLHASWLHGWITNYQALSAFPQSIDQTRGGHSYSKHGAQTTQQQHGRRIWTGQEPADNTPPAIFIPPNHIPPVSSKFTDSTLHVQTLMAADAELARRRSIGPLPNNVIVDVPMIDANLDPLQIGTSYTRGAPSANDPHPAVGTPATSARAIYRRNPLTNMHELITMYPTP